MVLGLNWGGGGCILPTRDTARPLRPEHSPPQAPGRRHAPHPFLPSTLKPGHQGRGPWPEIHQTKGSCPHQLPRAPPRSVTFSPPRLRRRIPPPALPRQPASHFSCYLFHQVPRNKISCRNHTERQLRGGAEQPSSCCHITFSSLISLFLSIIDKCPAPGKGNFFKY